MIFERSTERHDRSAPSGATIDLRTTRCDTVPAREDVFGHRQRHRRASCIGCHRDQHGSAPSFGAPNGASPQNYGYQRGGISRTSAVTTPKGVTVTRTSVREYLARQRERYHRLSRSDRSRLLTEMVAVTGYHRKAVLRCLSPLAPRRVSGRAVGRPRRYGADVASAAQMAGLSARSGPSA